MKCLNIVKFFSLSFVGIALLIQPMSAWTEYEGDDVFSAQEEAVLLEEDLAEEILESLTERGFARALWLKAPKYPCIYERIANVFDAGRSKIPVAYRDASSMTLEEQFLPRGKYIRLGNGSIWHVDSSDESEANSWNAEEIVSLKKNDGWAFFKGFGFCLYNHNRESSVQVKVSSVGRLNTEEGFIDQIKQTSGWVSSMILGVRLELNQGTHWVVRPQDNWMARQWKAGDVIVLGFSEDTLISRLSWEEGDRDANGNNNYPNLLMNLTKGSSCSARWVRDFYN